MRKKPSLIKNYDRLSEVNLDYKAQSIVFSLTGNEYFPVTDPTLAAITTIKDNYIAARENVANGGKLEIALKNQAKETLLYQLFLLGTNIESLAKGDMAKLVSSGYDLVKYPEPLPPITGPLIITVTDGLNPGEIKVSVNAIKGVSSYNFEYTSDEPGENRKWTIKSSTTKQITISGLTNGVKYYFRTVAIAKKGQELTSEIMARVAQ